MSSLKRKLVLLAGGVILATLSASTAFASHPNYTCTAAREFEIYNAPDLEVWICSKSTMITNYYYWVPLKPGILPGDAVAYKIHLVPQPTFQYLVKPRTEWINNIIMGGVDVHAANAAGQALNLNVGATHKVRLYSYDSTTASWTICRDEPWRSPTTAVSGGIVSTWNWGNAPCGSRWYQVYGYAGAWVNGTFVWITPTTGLMHTGAGAVTLSGTLAGGSPTGSNGLIYDARPGDAGKKPKKPKKSLNVGDPAPPPLFPTLGGALVGQAAAVVS